VKKVTREVVYPLLYQDRTYVGVPDYPYAASYYEDAGTELLARTMEENLLANIDASCDRWSEDMRDRTVTVLGDCECGPEFVLLLLYALRPGEMRPPGSAIQRCCEPMMVQACGCRLFIRPGQAAGESGARLGPLSAGSSRRERR
jgi:hypothetical protein